MRIIFVIFYHILECPDPCECDFFDETKVRVNCGGKSLNSVPWKFPLAMSELWVPLNRYKHQKKTKKKTDVGNCFPTKSLILRGIPLMLSLMYFIALREVVFSKQFILCYCKTRINWNNPRIMCDVARQITESLEFLMCTMFYTWLATFS